MDTLEDNELEECNEDSLVEQPDEIVLVEVNDDIELPPEELLFAEDFSSKELLERSSVMEEEVEIVECDEVINPVESDDVVFPTVEEDDEDRVEALDTELDDNEVLVKDDDE